MNMSSWLKTATLTLFLIAAFMFGGAVAASAQTPYEPNDDAATAFGPLFNLQSYSASLETENDADYYYFYVTTPATSQVKIHVDYTSGGGIYDEVYVDILDSDQDGIGSNEMYKGDSADVSVSLGAGKYYVSIEGDQGANYTISTSGTEGSFSDYTPIANACASATESLNAQNALLSTAALRLKAATRKVIRTRHKSRYAKTKARRNKASAKRAFNIANDGVRAAVKGQKPWCFIPR